MRRAFRRLRSCASGGAAKRFRSDVGGATAVEFGIVSLPLFAVVLAIFELGYVNFESEMLAAAATQAARAMLTGQLQGAGVSSAQQFVTTYLCPSTGRTLPTSFDCSKIVVDVRTAASFPSADLSNDFYKGTDNEFCPGAPGSIVILRVAYPLPAIAPLNLFSPSAGVVDDVPGESGWHHILLGESVFVEEEYSDSFTPPAGC
jgi:Flp pilus assembly protein TadG